MGSFRISASSNNSEAASMQELHSSQHMDTTDNSAVGLGRTSRQTAQMSFEITSEPSSTKQLRALIIKNFKVRTRDLPQTINAVFQPMWMMLILVFLHLSAKDAPNHLDVRAFPFLSSDTCKSTTDCTYFGYTGIPATDPIISELSGFFTASEPQSVVPKFFVNEQAMSAAYDVSPVNFVVGVVFLGPSTNLSTPDGPNGSSNAQYSYKIMANHTAYANHDYVGSRFATAQAYVERAAINLHRKANGKPPLSSPLPLKNDPGTGTSGAGRIFISSANFVGTGSSISVSLNAYYIIFCFQAVWLGVLSILVVEKSLKIRSSMSMMGLDSNAYLASLWLMQNTQNLVICALMILILFAGRIFVRTNALIVYFILILFSFNATAFGSMASVIVPDPKKTNAVSFFILALTVGSYGICSAFVFGMDSVNPTVETIVFLLPPVALGRAIDYISGVEAAAGGVTFANISTGPCSKALWMLVVDCVLYYFLAWYLDAVFPGEFGNALPFDFFLRPSYWNIGQYKRAAGQTRKPAPYPQPGHHIQQDSQHADMFENFDISRVPVEDRGIIQVTGLQKVFSTHVGFAYYFPLFGLILRFFYPPRPSRTSGPFAGVQKHEVVAKLDLEVHRNEIFGFLGHNGAGKTTSLSMIMGMLNPSAGTVIVDGHLMPGSEGVKRRDMDLRTLSEVQKLMGVCPQHDVLFDTLTAWETIQLYAAIKGVKVLARKSGNVNSSPVTSSTTSEGQPLLDESLLDDYLNQLLEDVYLHDKKHERVITFSGGMKRKLSVALAFLGDPTVVLLDEPTTGMDEYSKKSIWQLMQDSKAGRSILLTTHSMEEADALSDRIAIISHGRLQTLGSSLFLKNRFGLGYRLSLEKRRAMLTDHQKYRNELDHDYGANRNDIQSGSAMHGNEVVLFDEAKLTALIQTYFPDATIDVNTATDITYILPTTGTAEQRGGRTSQEYIQDKKAALPGLFEHLDQEIAANRIGVKSVGLSLTTLEEVFVSLQEQEDAKDGATE